MEQKETRNALASRTGVDLLERLLGELGQGARPFRFRVAPNPCVGAAVLSEGVEIGRGFHKEWGGPHAEVHALQAAESSGVPRAQWDTLLCTLEPCSSQGKTPPCTDAILATGIRRVVVGALDPDPRHRGKSLELLRSAGLEVEILPGSAPLVLVSPHFLRWTHPDRLRRQRPWLIAKWAQTRSGQLSPPMDVGGGRWISGPVARADVHVLRGRVDAILTGIGTVLADDPRLSVRPPGYMGKPPLRVVLDGSLRTPPTARLFADAAANEAAGAVVVIGLAGASPLRHRALEERGVEVRTVHPGDDGHVSLIELAELLWQRGVRRMLLESGPTLLESAFEAGLVDQLAVYSGSVSGGRGPSLARRLAAENLREIERREIGEDALIEAFLA